MSEWIDLSIYAVSSIVLWIMLPLAYRQLTVPALVDRNPDWVAAHPEAVQRMARSFWFNNTCIAWGVFSIVMLVLTMLGAGVAPEIGAAPTLLWQRLNSVSNMLFTVGFIGFGTIMYLAQRAVNRNVPQGVRRSASLRPRSAGDSIPLGWRILTDALTILHLAAWVGVGVLGLDQSPKHWGGFIFLLIMSVVFAVMAIASARRPPMFMDRVYGPAYRHRELRVMYGIRLAIVVFGAIALTSGIVGQKAMPVDPVRLAFLLFQILFVACLLAFVLIKPVGNAPQSLSGAP